MTCSNRSYFYNREELIPRYPEELMRPLPDSTWRGAIDNLLRDVHETLKEPWLVMKRFCMLASLSGSTRRHMHSSTIHQTMSAVMYRVMQMSFPTDSADELVRQGLLLYASHIFLQWQDIKMPFPQASSSYKTLLSDTQASLLPPLLVAWLAMAGSLSVFDVSQEPWLRQTMRQQLEKCNVKTWSSLRTALKSFMWVDILDEPTGKAIFAAVRVI